MLWVLMAINTFRPSPGLLCDSSATDRFITPASVRCAIRPLHAGLVVKEHIQCRHAGTKYWVMDRLLR